MNKTTKHSLIVVGVLASTLLGAHSALAFGGDGHKGFHRGGDRAGGLVPTELRQEWRTEKQAEFKNLTDEERQALRAEMKEKRGEMRIEKKQAFQDFTGLTRDEVKEARQSGESMGDILGDQGITETEAETFLTSQATKRADHIVERHNLDAQDEQIILERVSSFVKRILGKWFGSTS